ncbi:hypothetical protein G4B84_003877 [Aspergillus flavus NRRL3357]|nr:uncharacterized protein G4B84_003877 [Aspergillus flavus NRRL3357]QMW28588.1 hypothetical protein G4B84_003877 [Aspergillus flavus NRRL3357]
MASSDISSIPTPAHCTADFCLIPVRSESPFQNPSINPDNTSGKDQTVYMQPDHATCCPLHQIISNQTIQLTQNLHIRCPDRHLLPLRLRPNRRRPTPNREIRSQVRDAQRRHNPRCLFFWYWSDCEADGCVCVWHVCSEGPWDKVHQVIGQAHTVLHQQGIVRIQTDVRVGSRLVSFLFLSRVFGADVGWDRTDKEQSFEDKVNKVRQLLGKE